MTNSPNIATNKSKSVFKILLKFSQFFYTSNNLTELKLSGVLNYGTQQNDQQIA